MKKTYIKPQWLISVILIQFPAVNSYAQYNDNWAGEINAFNKPDSISAPPSSPFVYRQC